MTVFKAIEHVHIMSKTQAGVFVCIFPRQKCTYEMRKYTCTYKWNVMNPNNANMPVILSFLTAASIFILCFPTPEKCLSTDFSISFSVPKEPSLCLAQTLTLEKRIVPWIIHFSAEKWNTGFKLTCNLWTLSYLIVHVHNPLEILIDMNILRKSNHKSFPQICILNELCH